MRFDIAASREGAHGRSAPLAATVIFHIPMAACHIHLLIIGFAASRSLLPEYRCFGGRLGLFRRSAKAFPFCFPSTRFWPT
ncbi:hypothetical protein [Bradyrhizobium sp. Bra78]|uniref:hypothetical protein n=1 Tax=Bradyrhizobium sp. Bra78 TaxID=2926010 RepID=UPI0021C8FFEC|nr:hypothetical protein [Bradyrhizobium sp. Bra78]